MGWGTDFKADIYISREVYSSIYEVKSVIEEKTEYIRRIRDKLLGYCCCTPKDIITNNECDDAVDGIIYEFNELMSEYNRVSYEIFKLELLVDNFENKTDDI